MCFCALINPYNFYTIEKTALILIFLYTIFASFFLGSINNPTFKKLIISQRLNKINNTIFILSSSLMIFVVGLMLTYGLNFQNVRDIFFFTKISGENSIFSLLIFPQLFLNSFLFYLLHIYAYCYYNEKSKFVFNNLLKTCMSIILLDMATGGRMFMFYVVLINFIYILIYSKINIRYINKRSLRLFIPIFLFLAIVSFSRAANLQKFLYDYFVGPIYLLSYSIEDYQSLINNSIYDGRFGYSLMTLDWIIIGLLKKISLVNTETLFSLSNNFLSYGYYLNSQGGINAYFTGLLYHYKDFGIFAPITPLFFFWIIRKLTSRKVLKNLIIIHLSFFIIMIFRENILNAPFFLFSLIFLVLNPGVKNA